MTSTLRSSALLVRKREDDKDGRMHCMKEEDTCVRSLAVEEKEEKGRRKTGGGEEREEIDRGKDGLSIAAHGCVGIMRHLLRENGDFYQRCCEETSEKKRICAIAKCCEHRFVFLSFKINCIKALVRNSHHVWHQSCSYLS